MATVQRSISLATPNRGLLKTNTGTAQQPLINSSSQVTSLLPFRSDSLTAEQQKQHAANLGMTQPLPQNNRKVTIQETLFEFGDELNDLNSLEMLVSYQEIELRVKFSDQAQLSKWKTNIMQAHGKSGSVENSASSDRNRMMIASRQMGSQADQNNMGSQRSLNSEDIAPEFNNEYNISFEKSAIKPVALHAFSTKSKVNLERDALMREQRLTITRALITSIVNRR